MQEEDWLYKSDLWGMLKLVGGKPDARKLGLAACACIRRVPTVFYDPRLSVAITTAEDYADFRTTKQKVIAVKAGLSALIEEARARGVRDKSAIPDWVWKDPERAEYWTEDRATEWVRRRVELLGLVLRPSRVNVATLAHVIQIVQQFVAAYQLRSREAERAGLCALLREIFGNPFRPVTLNPVWLTDTVTALARRIYDSRDFSAMPILADALQDAGCDNDTVLNHCRRPGEHVRGCWVVDLLLGKT